jgi:cysteinyl-tRNA synthetase
MKNIEVDQIVVATPGSWCRIYNNIEKSCRGNADSIPPDLDTKEPTTYKVLATNVKLLVTGNTYYANTLIQTTKTGVCIAINSCNLQPYVKTVSIKFVSNGIDITDELSEVSKQAILKANLTEEKNKQNCN